ncbi:cysteine--1-D-myo-inosityl 2-amino-2-deoxy-alpha-D-glucopyranoside ligase [Actinoplanes sp. KI2]|uniref:cysteine--1-D-myo-inosityl 2-amino-2-deoxy-alpha-D-glucopyranoside ligase n=1 Tax=Actinoplanes sp. KI2 TaxID=2983315 RepID=UPI0021D61036|nr:cysteine--1-D-myo-inosityl 2-amino-2-deoxy-alpha-D-glucopyranoside ligase [Actinoplanes sp. KI2]MCU7725992.1 cysteine--1-D-myo-inosityl 2-amino-2-deoxy-alpha-D-glucopyranoside ligase [Actinoplanes sp. KI2]
MRVYCTAAGDLVPLEAKPRLTIYVCGLTPYDSMHLGHVALLLLYDVLARRLRSLGSEVVLVRNVTDVDDPLLERAQEVGVPFWELVNGEIAQMSADNATLDLPATVEPRASEHIEDMAAMVGELLDKGLAYTVDGWTYFAVDTDPEFGRLFGLSLDERIRLARERGGFPDRPGLRNPLDFVLWQPSRPGEPEYETALGRGRPGWHIGCSVMSRKHLGDHIDVHGGGEDLIFPHHECEAAQNRSVADGSAVSIWLHAVHVAYDGYKMSKSRGNIVLARTVLAERDARVLRLAVLSRYHHRRGFEWHNDFLDDAESLLDRLIQARAQGRGPGGDEYAVRCLDRIDDDLDFPAAVGVLAEWATTILDDPAGWSGDRLAEVAEVLGLDLSAPRTSPRR